MLNVEEAASRYEPRAHDTPREEFTARLTKCSTCTHRQGQTCDLSNAQLCTVLARCPTTHCPAHRWPGEEDAKRQAARTPTTSTHAASTHRLGMLARLRSLLTRRAQPYPTLPAGSPRFTGVATKKPWDYEVTAVIPTLDAAERLPLVVELLRLQTVKPFIVIVDTGSQPQNFRELERMRAADVEVHSLRLNAVQHPSEPVAVAMDAAAAACRTRFLFATHDDCFLRRRTVLENLRDLAASHKLAGHRLTRRPHDDWDRMTGHTCLMLDHDWILDQGITWSMRRGMRLFGIDAAQETPGRPNWPDTEIGFNYLCRLAGATPYFTGQQEANGARNVDEWIDHCRSLGASGIYNPTYHAAARKWLRDALVDARARIAGWNADPLPAAQPLAPVPPAARLTIPHFTPGNY